MFDFAVDKPREFFEPRYYQLDAVSAIWQHIRNHDDNPCAVLPTGSGKTIVLAQLCKDVIGWEGRVLLLSHVKELLAQGHEKISSMVDIPVGLYSAGLKRRDINQQIIVAGIQSVAKRACELGAFDIIIVDEAHLIPTENDGQYTRFLADAKIVNPKVRVVGLTATDYRLNGGRICKPDNILNQVCYEVGIKELQTAGFLSKLSTKKSMLEMDESKLHKKMGEFIESELAEQLDTDEKVREAVKEIKEYSEERKACLIFCINIEHGNHVLERLKEEVDGRCDMVTGKTAQKERDQMLIDFKLGLIAYMVNVNVLSVGFDAPNIDMVCMMRPTASPGLYYQQVGRGFRVCEGKADCLIIDFAGNVFRHGPVDKIEVRDKKERQEDGKSKKEAPMKVCQKCKEIVSISYTICPVCGDEFPLEAAGHGSKGNLEDIISGDDEPVGVMETLIKKVERVEYAIHKKKNNNGFESVTLKISYFVECEKGDLAKVWPINEWLALENKRCFKWSLQWWLDVSEGAYQMEIDGDNIPSIEMFCNEYAEKTNVPQYIEVKKKTTEKFWQVNERIFAHNPKCAELNDMQSKQEEYDNEPDQEIDGGFFMSESEIPF